MATVVDELTTKMYPWGAVVDCHRGDNTQNARGTNVGWNPFKLSTSAGSSAAPNILSAIAGPTAGVETGGSNPDEYISEPLAADLTISGTITFNIWGDEPAMTTNAGPQVIIERLDSTLAVASTIVNSEAGIEFSTASAVVNWTATPTSTAMNRGDRIRVRLLGNDAGGTMAVGNCHITTGGPTGGANGDTWLQFNENLTFETADPSGTQLFLTTTAASGGINPGSASEKESWTSRGGGSTSSVTNITAGFHTPDQVTDTAGGTLLEWYTRPLQAFTLGGKAKANLRLTGTQVNAGISARAEIAICDSGGNLVSVWGAADVKPTGLENGSQFGSLDVTEAARTFYIAGDDTAVSNGQRLRIRVFEDDCAGASASAGQTMTMTYAGTTGGAAGDSWVTLPQSVTEYVATAASIVAGISRPKHLIRAGF